MAKSLTAKTPLASSKNELLCCDLSWAHVRLLFEQQKTAVTPIELPIWVWSSCATPNDEAIQRLSHTLCTKWRPLFHCRMSAHVVTYHEVRTPISAHSKHGTPATYTWHLPRGEEREPDLPLGISSLTLGHLCGGEGSALSWAWRGFLFPKTPLC